jgi:hypothetical protein
MEYYEESDRVAELVEEAMRSGLSSLPRENSMPMDAATRDMWEALGLVTPDADRNASENPFLDPRWRLNNIYRIKDKNGQIVKFRFNKFQEELWRRRWYNNVVIKARQLGVTTFYAIMYLDAVLFNENQTAGIIAHTEKDAKKIFEDTIRFAYAHLHEELRRVIPVTKDSADQMSFGNGSSIFVSVSTRADTVQYLHVSEFGYTSVHYPDKAQEIMAGSLNSVHKGQMVSVESTAHGRQGKFFELYERAVRAASEKRKLHEMDYRLFFFPWWQEKEYALETGEGASSVIPRDLAGYFEQLAAQGIALSPSQQQWYTAKKATAGDDIFSEFPSTAQEAFSASTEGAYYGSLIRKAIEEKRVGNVPPAPGVPIDTWWDLGMNDFTVILFTQTVGPDIHFIDIYYNRNEGFEHYLRVLKLKMADLGYQYGRNYFPHDLNVREWTSGKKRTDFARECGIFPLIAPKLPVQEGINMVRGLFPRFRFDEEKCAPLINALFNYRNEWDEKLGQFGDKPLHDEYSHFADALRVLGVMFRNIPEPPSEKPEPFDRHSLFSSFPWEPMDFSH